MKLLIIFLLPCSFLFAQQKADTTLILQDLQNIIETSEYRNHNNLDALNQVAGYIHDEFQKSSDRVTYQPYRAMDKTYKNVIASFGPEAGERIIIGAHYDVCGKQDGADDNASGVAGLLSLARMLKNEPLKYRIDLVAYSLEEPPFFRSQNMGSYVHATSLHENNVPVLGMISLEMIGYFSDEKKSQEFPIGLLKLKYGSRGNFITVVRKFGSGKFARKFKRKMTGQKFIRAKAIQAPSAIPGIDYSDHRNYWKYGYSALMITDTSFFRNGNYHKASDTLETLDIKRMAGVIDAVFVSLQRQGGAK